jgi:hypothetical protein
MDLSETIVAAMIGAGATVATATFQLVAALRSRKADFRPKRSSSFRSALAVVGLVLGAAVAGFAYSELRMQREREESRAMEQRIADRLQAIAERQLAQHGNAAGDATVPGATGAAAGHLRSEAMVRLPACRSQTRQHGNDAVGCDAANASRAEVCANIPSQANVLDVELFARADGAPRDWEQGRVSIDQDIGGARFVDSTFEVEQGAERKAVCAGFLHWSHERGHEARIVVVYTIAPATAVASEPGAVTPADSDSPAHDVPDTEAVAAVQEETLTSDFVAPDPGSGVSQAAIDPTPGPTRATIAPQP